MDDLQADAMGGGAERTAAFADMVERLSRVLPPDYGEQCADTDGLAAAGYGEGWLGDASVSDQHYANTNGLAAADTLEALLTKHLRIVEERLAQFMRHLDATPRPPSAGWHDLLYTSPQPKPLPARALNARYRGGLITEVAP